MPFLDRTPEERADTSVEVKAEDAALRGDNVYLSTQIVLSLVLAATL